jgi:hypothetical protein
LRDVIESLLGPSVLSSRDRSSGGAIYARMITQLVNDQQEHAVRISRTYSDPIARATLDALQKVLRDADGVALTWGYLFTIGAMTAALANTGRAKRLNTACNPNDVQETLCYLTSFVEGGIRELVREGKTKGPETARTPKKVSRRRTSRRSAVA